MELKYPYWYRTLQQFDRNGYIMNGLSIPFVIGSRSIVECNYSIETVSEFIDSINNSSIYVSILRCNQLGEFVINLLDRETNKLRRQSQGAFIELGNVVCVDLSLQGVCSVIDLTTLLSGLYQEHVDLGNFSKVRGTWGPYTEEDKQRLMRIRY